MQQVDLSSESILKMDCHPVHQLTCFCGRTYVDPVDLEEHRRARGHFPSHICQRNCNHPAIGKQILQEHKCGTCGKICNRLDILQDHRIATGHCFCSECGAAFKSEDALAIHRKTKIHASEFRCCDCDLSFPDIHALKAHMASPRHRKPVEKQPPKKTIKQSVATSLSDRTCKQCHKTFKSTEALQSHSQSLKHKPLSTLDCPVGKGCRGKFAAPSALLHHLESGNCTSGIDRDDVYHMVQLCDKDRIVHSVPTLTPASSGDFSADSPSPRLNPSTPPLKSSTEWELISARVAQWSWIDLTAVRDLSTKGGTLDDAAAVRNLRCPLCPKSRKEFSTPQALEQHMMSPAHGEKLYHCPTNLQVIGSNGSKQKGKKEKQFTTMGGLAQHLESGACYGGKQTFLRCVDLIHHHLEQAGLGKIRLLLPGARS